MWNEQSSHWTSPPEIGRQTIYRWGKKPARGHGGGKRACFRKGGQGRRQLNQDIICLSISHKTMLNGSRLTAVLGSPNSDLSWTSVAASIEWECDGERKWDMQSSLWERGSGSVHINAGDTEGLPTSYVASWGRSRGGVPAQLSCTVEGKRTRKPQISQFHIIEHNSILLSREAMRGSGNHFSWSPHKPRHYLEHLRNGWEGCQLQQPITIPLSWMHPER